MCKGSLPIHVFYNKFRKHVFGVLFFFIISSIVNAHEEPLNLIASPVPSISLSLANSTTLSNQSNTNLRIPQRLQEKKKRCRARVIVNVSLGSIAVAGLVSWVVLNSQIRDVVEEMDPYDGDLHKAADLRIKFGRLTAARNLLSILTLGSSSALAVSFVFPFGNDDCSSQDKHFNVTRRKSKRHKEQNP